MVRRQHLRTLLQEHTPADATEARHRERMLELCESDGDPTSRAHFGPGHFTASGFVLAPEGDALLLIHHRKLARWLQPGGHVDPGDADLIAAGRREVHEEVGLAELPLAHAGAFDLDVHAIPPLGSEPPHEHFDVRFLFRAASRDFDAGDEVLGGRWFPLAELDDRASDASVMRVVHKLRRD